MERTREQELMKLIDQLISTKLTEDENYLRFSFYEVRVKGKVEESEENRFLELAKTKLNNMGYNVYLENDEFIYNDANMRVQPNELLIAIKELKGYSKWTY